MLGYSDDEGLDTAPRIEALENFLIFLAEHNMNFSLTGKNFTIFTPPTTDLISLLPPGYILNVRVDQRDQFESQFAEFELSTLGTPPATPDSESWYASAPEDSIPLGPELNPEEIFSEAPPAAAPAPQNVSTGSGAAYPPATATPDDDTDMIPDNLDGSPPTVTPDSAEAELLAYFTPTRATSSGTPTSALSGPEPLPSIMGHIPTDW